MLPPRPCWLPDDTASEAKAMSEVAGHLLHTICSSHEERLRPARLAVMHDARQQACEQSQFAVLQQKVQYCLLLTMLAHSSSHSISSQLGALM